jgi:hypothetical protein
MVPIVSRMESTQCALMYIAWRQMILLRNAIAECACNADKGGGRQPTHDALHTEMEPCEGEEAPAATHEVHVELRSSPRVNACMRCRRC